LDYNHSISCILDLEKICFDGFVIFCAASLLGAISQHFDESFADIIIGEQYFNDTEARIEAGDPLGIYGESSETSMVFRITFNNINPH